MARWRAWRPRTDAVAAPLPLLAVDESWDSPEARRAHWGVLAMDLLRDTEVPTPTVLSAYLDRVLTP